MGRDAQPEPAGSPWIEIPKETMKEFMEDEAPLHAAALSFFTLFAVVPLFVLVILGAAFIWGDGESARSTLFHGAGQLLGEEQADALQSLISNAQAPGSGLFATIVGAAVLAFAASRVFAYIEKSLNRIWDVRPRGGRSLWRTAKKRFLSFAMVLGIGFLLLASLIVSSLLSGLVDYLADRLPFEAVTVVVLRIVLTLLVLWGLFMLMYRYLPDARIRWSDVVVGAFATALLFTVGQVAIGRTIGGSTLATSFGALSSIVVVLLWFYYTALIFLLGAEFTQVYARWQGHPIEPEADIAEREGRKRGGAKGRGRAGA